jgi:hypothetical protein
MPGLWRINSWLKLRDKTGDITAPAFLPAPGGQCASLYRLFLYFYLS